MASAVVVRYEHKVNIDRSKETDRFYCEFTKLRIIMRERKKGPEKSNGDSWMPFPIYAYFLILDYEHVLSDYSRPIKLVT